MNIEIFQVCVWGFFFFSITELSQAIVILLSKICKDLFVSNSEFSAYFKSWTFEFDAF